MQLTSNLIIGVKEFDWRQRAAISGARGCMRRSLLRRTLTLVLTFCTEHGRDSLPVRPAVRLTAPALERPYLIARAPGGGVGALSGVEPRTSLLGKFGHYVLGL